MTIAYSSALAALPTLPSDNCSRVDFVKGAANQLKMKLSAAASHGAPGPNDSHAQASLSALNDAIKTGDSRKAEAALAAANSAIEEANSSDQTDRSDQNPGSAASSGRTAFGRFQAWA